MATKPSREIRLIKVKRRKEQLAERKRLAKIEKARKKTEYNIAKAEKAESDARRRKALRKAREEHPIFRLLSPKAKAKRRKKKAWWE